MGSKVRAHFTIFFCGGFAVQHYVYTVKILVISKTTPTFKHGSLCDVFVRARNLYGKITGIFLLLRGVVQHTGTPAVPLVPLHTVRKIIQMFPDHLSAQGETVLRNDHPWSRRSALLTLRLNSLIDNINFWSSQKFIISFFLIKKHYDTSSCYRYPQSVIY